MLHILTLSWEGKEKLQKLKQSLLPALDGLDWVWHIKENGSKDGSVDEVKSWNIPQVNLIEYSHNKDNYAQGMNFLFKEASTKDGDNILTLNNDIIVNDSSSIKNMLSILEDKNVGGVGAKLNYTNTDVLQHCGVLFHQRNGLPYHYRAKLKEESRDRDNRYYPAVTGAVSIFPAKIFENCFTENKSGNKGFNENYHFGFEDIDFCLRIKHNLKKEIVYCGKTNIFHEESASLKKKPVQKLFFNHNAKLFLDTWHKHINAFLHTKYEDSGYNLYRS